MNRMLASASGRYGRTRNGPTQQESLLAAEHLSAGGPPLGVMTADDPAADFLARAGRWVAALEPGDLPGPVRRAAVAGTLSTAGAAAWTLDLPEGDRIASLARGAGGDGDVSFLPGGPANPVRAAYGHAALSMALDFDDTVLGGHVGHSTVWTALAYAEATGASGAEALTAIVAGNEVAARVASAAAVGPFRGQQTAYVHLVGAAVARASLEDRPPDEVAAAVAFALGQPPWPLTPAFLGSDAKVTTAAEPTRTGIAAVDAAGEGLSGTGAVLDGDGGFLEAFADYPLPEFLTGLGDRWHTRAVTVKPYPGCAYVTAPVHAALAVRDRLAGRASVSHVDVFGPLFTHRVDEMAAPYVEGPDSPIAALNFSVPYNVAVALVDGEHTPRQFRPDRRRDPDVWALADRVAVRHDPDLTMAALESEVPLGAMLRRVGPGVVPYAAKTLGPATALRHLPTLLRFVRRRPLPDDLAEADKRMGARVAVTLSDGRTLVEDCPHPPGFAGRPLVETRAIARKKLRAGLEARCDDGDLVDRAVDAVRYLGDAEPTDLSPLVAALERP